jgi:3',5'-cyclic AMP phosphodiesterase CpdA
MHRNPVIVQISDLHFGKSVKPYRFWESAVNEDAKKALREAILEIEPRPDFLVVTGDLAEGGKPKQLRESRKYLESILDDLWREHHVTRCILVPGNHDVWRTTVACFSGYLGRRDRLEEFDAVFDNWSFLAPSLPVGVAQDLLPKSLLDYYLEHGGTVGGPPPDRDQAQRLAAEALRVCEFFPVFHLAFLKLNSNVRLNRWKPGHIARGMVSIDQRDSVNRILRHYEQATQDEVSAFADARRIALVHHHVTRLPNVKQENWMLMDDAGEVARWLARQGVRLVLHGHYHRADLVGLTYWNTESNNSKVETIVVSAGAATARAADDGHNSCHYIDLGHFRTKVWRPFLDHGEYEKLAAAASFEFPHKPDLKIEEVPTQKIPVFLEALAASVAAEEKYEDREHIYTAVKSTGFIDTSRAYFGTVELEGRNVTKRQTTGIPFVFTAVGAQYFAECNCRAWDLKTGRELSIVPIEERPIYVFPSRISFAPLGPQEVFQIRVQFNLKMVMLEERDYDMLNILRFPMGVETLNMRLLSEKTIEEPAVWELRGDRLRQSDLPLRLVTEAPPHPAGRGKAKGYEINIESPSALSYMLFYERLA